MKALMLACCFTALLPRPLLSTASLTIRVSPRVMLAPGFLTIQTTIEANADNRAMEVVADSPAFFRSSWVTLDGDRAPRVNEFVFKGLPAGRYEVTVRLMGPGGQRAADTRWFHVASAGYDELP
jgi:hypothetical protein